MKRSNFLKSLLGLAALPEIAKAMPEDAAPKVFRSESTYTLGKLTMKDFDELASDLQKCKPPKRPIGKFYSAEGLENLMKKQADKYRTL